VDGLEMQVAELKGAIEALNAKPAARRSKSRARTVAKKA